MQAYGSRFCANNEIMSSGKVMSQHGYAGSQRDLKVLNAKCQVLHLGRNNSVQHHRLAEEWVGSCPAQEECWSAAGWA